MTAFRAGFVGLVGRPNVGKSTLLNQVLGEKLAIATPKPQTTRNRLVGVHNVTGAQLVLVDTPGLHRPTGKGRSRLNVFMMDEALAALSDVDVVVVLAELPSSPAARKRLHAGEAPLDPAQRFVFEEVARSGKPTILAVNKIDLVRDKRLLLPVLEAYGKLGPWAAVVPISAKTGSGVDRLVEELVPLLPEGEALFPEEMITDRAERWLAAEFVREQIFLRTSAEVPYGAAVTIDAWTERPARGKHPADVTVSATIHVEKDAHKRIVVGQGGRMIKEIGSIARQEIAALLGCPVHLELFVRVDEGWTERAAALKEMGYERD